MRFPLFLHIAWSLAFLISGTPAQQPNIVFVMVDDMGYSDLGCYGGEILTPNVDSLADDGLRFTNFCVTPMCVTSRASILSGMEYHAAGAQLIPDGLSFAYLLRDAGYHTSLSGKVHAFGNIDPGIADKSYGFDRFFGFRSGATNCFLGDSTWRLDSADFTNFGPDFYSTDAITDYAIDFIDQALTQEKPFFTWVCYNAPHTPLQAPEANVRKYSDTRVYAPGWDKLREERFERQKAMGIVGDDWTLPEKSGEVPDWNKLPRTSNNAWMLQKEFEALTMSAYAGMVDRIDENVGRLLDHLRDPDGNGNQSDSVLDDTLIVFCSDNGGAYGELYTSRNAIPWDRNAGGDNLFRTNFGWGMLKNTPYRYYKHSSHGGGIKSSLVAHWPNGITVPGGSILHQSCNLWDFYPTFLELAGATYPANYTIPGTAIAKAPKPLMGESIVPLFTDADSPAGSDRFISSYERSRGLIDNGYKAVSYIDSPWELFNLVTDPTERIDLAGVRPDILADLIQQWHDHDAAHDVINSWDPTPGTKHRGWGFDRIRSGLASSVPDYSSAGVPLDTKLSFTFTGTIDFNGTAGKKIRLQRYGNQNILWESDPDATHPAQGTSTITFTDFPKLEPDTHYYVTWDGGWAKNNGTPIAAVREAVWAFRFKTAATFGSSAISSQGMENFAAQLDPFSISLDGDLPLLQFRTPRNPIDAKLRIEQSIDLINFSPIFELDGQITSTPGNIVSQLFARDYDDKTDYVLRLDSAEIGAPRAFFRATTTWNDDTTPLAAWTFQNGMEPVSFSDLATPQDATFSGDNSGIVTSAGVFTFPDPIIAWSGGQLPATTLNTQIQTALTATEPIQLTRVQYIGYLWSDRGTTNASSVSADVVAWLNGAIDTPGIISSQQEIIAGTGGTDLSRFCINYYLDSKTLLAGDQWDLRLRLRDANPNTDTISMEGFGIDSVLVYGEPYVDTPGNTVIADYEFNGSGISSDSDPLTTASDYSMGYYNSTSPGTSGFTSNVNGLALPSGTATSSFDRDSDPTLTDAQNTVNFSKNTHLHEFTITIPASVTASLSVLDFEWGAAETQFFNGLQPNIQVVTDKTGATILAADTFTIPAGVTTNIYSPAGTGTLQNYSIDLSDQPALQNLSGTSVTFILAMDELQNKDATTRRHLIDNVKLRANVDT